MAELGCQHITISAAVLQMLKDTPDTLPKVDTEKSKHPYATLSTAKRLKGLSQKDDLAGPEWNGVFATMDTDYIANGGAKLDEFIQADPIVKQRFNDANSFFLDAEDKARRAIEHEMEVVGLKAQN